MQNHDRELTKRPTGEWAEGTQGHYCSECEEVDTRYFDHDFCPKCGAMMKKEDNKNDS